MIKHLVIILLLLSIGRSSITIPSPIVYQIEMEPVYQNPGYPNGCELASLTAVLTHHDMSTNIGELMQYFTMEDIRYVNGAYHGPHPNLAYPNSPDRKDGWYCYESVIENTAKKYLLEKNEMQYAVKSSVEYSLDDLFYFYIRYGTPVIIWATTNYSDPIRSDRYFWYLPDGTKYIPYVNLHCIVLLGIDYIESMCTVMDPLAGVIQIEYETLKKCYESVGSRSVAIKSVK